jgi:hypothetical protein
VSIKPFATFAVKNTGGHGRMVYAYLTNFDHQAASIADRTQFVGAGETFAHSFERGCVQLDLSTEAVGGRPDIGYAIFDKRGAIITPANREAAITECRTPEPSPTPCPTPKPKCNSNTCK